MSNNYTSMASFIKQHHVLSLATFTEEAISVCSVFYLYIEEEALFIFASSEKSEHIRNIENNPNVAAGIHEETFEVNDIRGVQVKGTVMVAKAEHINSYEELFPYAKKLKDKKIYALKAKSIKYTDNAELGLGNKETWTSV